MLPSGEVHVLDLAAKLDCTAEYVCKSLWGAAEFPPPFGRDAFAEEAYIAELDAKTGASLKVNYRCPSDISSCKRTDGGIHLGSGP